MGPVSRLHIFPRRCLGDFHKAGCLPSVQMPLFLQRAAHPPARKEFRLGILPPSAGAEGLVPVLFGGGARPGTCRSFLEKDLFIECWKTLSCQSRTRASVEVKGTYVVTATGSQAAWNSAFGLRREKNNNSPHQPGRDFKIILLASLHLQGQDGPEHSPSLFAETSDSG